MWTEAIANDDEDETEDARRYRAVRGRRKPLLKFVPHDRPLRRYLQFSDLRLMDVSESGDVLRIEFSAVMVLLEGERLEAVADAVQGMMGASFEAFDSRRHDTPDTRPGEPPEPFIRQITFFTQKPEEPGRRKPAHEPETLRHDSNGALSE